VIAQKNDFGEILGDISNWKSVMQSVKGTRLGLPRSPTLRCLANPDGQVGKSTPDEVNRKITTESFDYLS